MILKNIAIGRFYKGVWKDTADPFAAASNMGALPTIKPFLYTDGDDGWLLTKDFYIRIGTDVYYVRRGFDFDGASIPKLFWSLTGHPMSVKPLVPALIHDILYASHTEPRAKSDTLFFKLLSNFGNTKIKSFLYWLAVTICGWFIYRRAAKMANHYKWYIRKYTIHQVNGEWMRV